LAQKILEIRIRLAALGDVRSRLKLVFWAGSGGAARRLRSSFRCELLDRLVTRLVIGGPFYGYHSGVQPSVDLTSKGKEAAGQSDQNEGRAR
jgi:hypothetical protein